VIPLTQEIIRKSLHLSNLIIPLFLYTYDRHLTLSILLPLTIIFLIIDILRVKNAYIKKLYNTFFKSITRDSENNSLTGASYVFISSSLVILLFSKSLAIASLMIMSISDTLAAIIGRLYGSIHINGKTLEGSIAFFLSSVAIVSIFPKLNLLTAIISVIIATITELYSAVDDNLSVPISFSLSYILIDIAGKFFGAF
jgi:dolichol kinase